MDHNSSSYQAAGFTKKYDKKTKLDDVIFYYCFSPIYWSNALIRALHTPVFR